MKRKKIQIWKSLPFFTSAWPSSPFREISQKIKKMSLRGCTVVSQNVWYSISLKLNKLRSLLQNMLIGHGNLSLILSIHRRQTSCLGTFKCKLSLVFKTSCIGLKVTYVEVIRLFWWMWREIKSISANLYLFYICMTIVPFQRDITRNKKIAHTYRLLKSGVIFERV